MTKTKIDWCDYRIGNSRIKSEKYILVYCPQHPHSKSKGHVYEHRYVMEKCLKRFLKISEHVHHLDGNESNNEIGNLILMRNGEHTKLHYYKNPSRNKNGILALNKYAAAIKLPRIIIKCACGCGIDLINRDNKGRIREYIHGHNAKGKNWRWKKNE